MLHSFISTTVLSVSLWILTIIATSFLQDYTYTFLSISTLATSVILTFIDVRTAYSLGARIQGHKVTPKQIRKYCFSHLSDIVVLALHRLILFPLTIIERLFAPLGSFGSLVVRPFEYFFGSLWMLISAFTPHTLVFTGSAGFMFRKTVLGIRKKRGRYLRLRTLWLLLFTLIFTAGFILLGLYVLRGYDVFLLVAGIVGVTVYTGMYLFYRYVLALWHTAIYLYLVTGKYLPPFHKDDIRSSALYRISKD